MLFVFMCNLRSAWRPCVGKKTHFARVLSHLQQIREEVGVVGDPLLQALQVQPEEAQQFVRQEGVVEELGGESAKHQLPHDVAVHRSHLTCAVRVSKEKKQKKPKKKIQV